SGSFTVNVFDRETQPGIFTQVSGGTGHYDFSNLTPVTRYNLNYSINPSAYTETYSILRTEGQSTLSTTATRQITIDQANGVWNQAPCDPPFCYSTPWGTHCFPGICPPPYFMEFSPGTVTYIQQVRDWKAVGSAIADRLLKNTD